MGLCTTDICAATKAEYDKETVRQKFALKACKPRGLRFASRPSFSKPRFKKTEAYDMKLFNHSSRPLLIVYNVACSMVSDSRSSNSGTLFLHREPTWLPGKQGGCFASLTLVRVVQAHLTFSCRSINISPATPAERNSYSIQPFPPLLVHFFFYQTFRCVTLKSTSHVAYRRDVTENCREGGWPCFWDLSLATVMPADTLYRGDLRV
ncbi:hypothetical protein HPP92_028889 [Vanilla planifolia]|uniref:Uncharacterized protein n=1 Tax=Vanilla planifolia TaxID=51239 RepID=A0A835U3E8_VANPL|nr:hypothetical protein HPP92_028889 [Vanilla planifolia]KAG0446350.1 hypothetical protein HPP92_028878 [Vanilla planifolia]